jgi:hypothetical protein
MNQFLEKDWTTGHLQGGRAARRPGGQNIRKLRSELIIWIDPA